MTTPLSSPQQPQPLPWTPPTPLPRPEPHPSQQPLPQQLSEVVIVLLSGTVVPSTDPLAEPIVKQPMNVAAPPPSVVRASSVQPAVGGSFVQPSPTSVPSLPPASTALVMPGF